MTIDIRDEIQELLAYVCRRVSEHVADGLPQLVTQIDFGFEFGHENWVVLVFDTRPHPWPDSRWTVSAPEFLMWRPGWPKLSNHPENEPLVFIDLSGQEVDVIYRPDELACDVIGKALRHVLLIAAADGVFSPLPKVKRCEIAVENFDGYYSWLASKDSGGGNRT